MIEPERRGTALRGLSVALVLFLVLGTIPALADTTPVQTSNEPSLDQPGGILDQLYGLGNLVRIDDSNADPIDQLWTIMGPAGATATARFAGLTPDFGFFPGENPSAAFVSLFVVGGSGFVTGPTVTFMPSQTGSTFRFGVSVSSGDLWSTRPSDNSDAYDHAVTWQIVSSDAAHPSNPIGAFAVGWEDLPVAAPPAPTDLEPDYNDLVLEITSVEPSICGDGIISNGETCDDGNTSGGDCCSATCQIEPAGGVCRASAGACDGAETCDGLSASCPVDQIEPVGTLCRASNGLCDTAEVCDGLSVSCGPDAFVAGGTACRPGAGLCDVGEVCDGLSASCPLDVVLAAGSVCRASGGSCDPAEVCNGTLATCGADTLEAAGTVCNPALGVCDLAETCDGLTTTCPLNVLASAGSVCRSASGACDTAETCDGLVVTCAPDAFAAAGTVCNPAAGACDLAETCDGAAAACPSDVLAAAGSVCRASAGACDPAEVCDGVLASCAGDALEPAGTVCNPALGLCDLAETCDGLAASCATDALASAGSVCRPASGACDTAETCDGLVVTCAPDALAAAGTVCNPAAGTCDLAETCDGATDVCPTDALAAAGSTCRPAAGACDVAETCDGLVASCAPDVLAAAGVICNPAAGTCDVPESCDGALAACPADTLVSAGSVCRPASGLCDVAEACDGVLAACLPDALEPAGTVCNAAVDLCDVEEVCNGSLTSCPADLTAPAGTVCRAASFGCDAAEACDGLALSCPADQIAADGSMCDSDPCTTDSCLAGVCQVAPLPPGTPPPADFILVVDATVSMRRDFKQWLPGLLSGFPAELAAAGIDYRLAIVRFGTNRKGQAKRGPAIPDVVLPCTNDLVAFDQALFDMMEFNIGRCSDDPLDPRHLNCIRNATETGSEAIRFALEDPSRLGCRPDAVPNVLLMTDEDDDSPALDTAGNLNTEKREPPSRGIKCYGRQCQSRWLPFQQRTDDTAALLVSHQAQLSMIQKTRNSPTRNQYGDPACTQIDSGGFLDRAATLSCLVEPDRRGFTPTGTCDGGTNLCTTGRIGQACSVDADCNAFSLQIHLLSSGQCGVGGQCIAGRIGAPCAVDVDCSLVARAYDVPRNAEAAFPFFLNEYFPDNIREQRCPAVP